MKRDDVRALVDAGRVPPPGRGPGLFMVRLRLAGGSNGSSATSCTFVYDLYPPKIPDVFDPFPVGTRLAANKRPLTGRATYSDGVGGVVLDVGKYIAAPDNSIGFAYRDPNAAAGEDGIRLLICEERPWAGFCEPP